MINSTDCEQGGDASPLLSDTCPSVVKEIHCPNEHEARSALPSFKFSEKMEVDSNRAQNGDQTHVESQQCTRSDSLQTDHNLGPDSPLELLLRKRNELVEQIKVLTHEIEELGFKLDDNCKDDQESICNKDFDAPTWCVPIKANVLHFEWDQLAKYCQFDVIVMDPPWQLASHAPTRGVAIAYQQLPDFCIEDLPIQSLQTNGFIFIWVINNKYEKAFELMEHWGYRYVDDITWVKQTVNRRMAKGHGYYLQHAKETCLVGLKGNDPENCRHSIRSDIIFSVRRGQSQKPEELYEIIEDLVPNGKYLEIFGRKNNLRDYWVTIGNEL